MRACYVYVYMYVCVCIDICVYVCVCVQQRRRNRGGGRGMQGTCSPRKCVGGALNGQCSHHAKGIPKVFYSSFYSAENRSQLHRMSSPCAYLSQKHNNVISLKRVERIICKFIFFGESVNQCPLSYTEYIV